jgi:hypothetical protein
MKDIWVEVAKMTPVARWFGMNRHWNKMMKLRDYKSTEKVHGQICSIIFRQLTHPEYALTKTEMEEAQRMKLLLDDALYGYSGHEPLSKEFYRKWEENRAKLKAKRESRKISKCAMPNVETTTTPRS